MNGDDHAGKRSCPVRTPFSSSRYTCSRDSPVLHCGERAGLARNREAKARTKRGASLRSIESRNKHDEMYLPQRRVGDTVCGAFVGCSNFDQATPARVAGRRCRGRALL